MRAPRAIFLDRDGTVNETNGTDGFGRSESPLRLSELRIFPFAGECIREFNEMGFLVFIVTNQPGIAKGKMGFNDLAEINATIYDHVFSAGGDLTRIYSCLHHPDPNQVRFIDFLKECECRKPKPGLLFRAAKDYGVRLMGSWMIGDSWKDIVAGKSVGCRTILLNPAEEINLHSHPDFIAYDLIDAVKIVREEEARNGNETPNYDLSVNSLHCL